MVEYFRMNSPGRVAAAGVTLVELALVLAVLVLVLRLGLPAMGAVYDAIMLRTRLDDFASDLQLTRSIALQRNGRAVMCKGSDRVCQSSGGWQQGWFVFHDANGNGIRESDEEVLSEHEPLPAGWWLSGNNNVADYISYTGRGTSQLLGGSSFQAGTIVLCREAAGPAIAARKLVINSSGRPRTESGSVSSCP